MAPALATPGSTAPPEDRLPTGANVHVNALGLLQFGLVPRLEFGGATTFLVGAHFYNTGVLSYVVIPGDDETLNFSMGGNLGLRHYFHPEGAQADAYLGVFLEFAALKTTDDSDDLAEYRRSLLIPAVDAGYRWVRGKFLFDVGGVVGVAIPVTAEDRPLGANGCTYADSCLEESEATFFAMATLDVGFFL